MERVNKEALIVQSPVQSLSSSQQTLDFGPWALDYSCSCPSSVGERMLAFGLWVLLVTLVLVIKSGPGS